MARKKQPNSQKDRKIDKKTKTEKNRENQRKFDDAKENR